VLEELPSMYRSGWMPLAKISEEQRMNSHAVEHPRRKVVNQGHHSGSAQSMKAQMAG